MGTTSHIQYYVTRVELVVSIKVMATVYLLFISVLLKKIQEKGGNEK